MTGSSKTLSAAPQKWSQTTGWASGFSNFCVCFSLGLNPSNPGHNPPNTCKGASFNLPWGISTGRAATHSQHHGGLLGLGGNLWQGSEVSRKVIRRGGWSTSCRAISTAPHADTGTATQEGWGTNYHQAVLKAPRCEQTSWWPPAAKMNGSSFDFSSAI